MDTRISSINSFKGYDARPLRGFLMSTNNCGIATEMRSIADREGFKIFSMVKHGADKPFCSTLKIPGENVSRSMWAQDLWTIYNGKIFTEKFDEMAETIGSFFRLKPDFTENIARKSDKYTKLCNRLHALCSDRSNPSRVFDIADVNWDMTKFYHSTHIQGGNIYMVKGDKGDEIIIGENELKKFSLDEIGGMYNVEKITVLPQMDYHLDLFIRPLDNKRILLADDNMMLDVFKKIRTKAEELKSLKGMSVRNSVSRMHRSMLASMGRNNFAKTEEVEKILVDAGYDVIRVPGRIYSVNIDEIDNSQNLSCTCNYLNANVLKNKNGDIVYITNKSDVDRSIGLNDKTLKKINYCIEQAFIDIISKYVDPKHIYFVSGKDNYIADKMLPVLYGGIHCTCSEVPFNKETGV